VAEDVQKLDEIVEHVGLFLAALRRAHEDIIAAESTRLVDVLECRIWSNYTRGN
jgi:hypothetical protein